MSRLLNQPTISSALSARLRRVVRLHLDPEGGSPFWLRRAVLSDLHADDICGLDDLHRLGEVTTEELRATPIQELVPASVWRDRAALRMVQTGGTTGPGVWTCYRDDEFSEAFVEPFVVAAGHVGFPTGLPWLFIGPSGPHVIGQAAAAIARTTGSAAPFTVDFDPRWASKLPEGTFARRRYVQHVVEQSLAVLECQEVGVLFATPPILLQLADRMHASRRVAIAGIHYGGMRVTAETLERLQEAFPAAMHLPGYGNSLLGCLLPLFANEAPPTYYPLGHRIHIDTSGPGGLLCVSRFDESMLIVNLLERDLGELRNVPADAPAGFELPGIHDPRPPDTRSELARGLY